MSSHDWEMLIRLLLAAFLGGIVAVSYTHLRAHET